MSDGREHVVATVDRGEHGAIRIARKSFKDSPVYTDVRFFFRDDEAQLRPTQKGVTIRDTELEQVIAALTKIKNKISGQQRTPQPGSPTVTRDELEAEDREGVF